MATSGYSFPYSFSKSAIGIATASLAHELLPLGIRVNGIAPGLFATEVCLPPCSRWFVYSLIHRLLDGCTWDLKQSGNILPSLSKYDI